MIVIIIVNRDWRQAAPEWWPDNEEIWSRKNETERN